MKLKSKLKDKKSKNNAHKSYAIGRGYKDVRQRVAKAPKFSMCCGNCNSYYKKPEDEEECCQDSSVLEFDMIYEETRVYCLRWQSVKDE